MTFFRYIFREFIPPFFFSLSLIVFLFVLNLLVQMLGKIAGKGLPWMTVLEFFALNLAWMLALAVPMAVLVAVLSAYGRLSADGEITAFKTCGVGQLRLLTPALFMGVLMAVMLFEFNNDLLPVMNHRSRQLQSDIKRKRPTMILEPGVFLSDIPGHVLYAKEVNPETSELRNVLVYEEDDPEYATSIAARQGALRYAETIEGFEFTMADGQISRASKLKNGEFQETDFARAIFRITAPGMSLKRTDSDYLGDREMNIFQLRQKIREHEKQDAKRNARSINSMWVEINKKFSIPAACLVFAILGTVLGQMVRASGLGVAAGYSIFFFLIYWVFLIGGEDLADRGRIAPWVAMWSPNALFFLLAMVMLWWERRGLKQTPMELLKRLFAGGRKVQA
jgi:lipopolysaccharide export system permease protein